MSADDDSRHGKTASLTHMHTRTVLVIRMKECESKLQILALWLVYGLLTFPLEIQGRKRLIYIRNYKTLALISPKGHS